MLIQQGVNSGWWLWRQMAVLAPPDIPSLREKLPKARPERRRHAVCQRGARMLGNRVAGQEPMRVPLAVFFAKIARPARADA